MKTETTCITLFVGIFKNRRVPFRAIASDALEAKSEDGFKSDMGPPSRCPSCCDAACIMGVETSCVTEY